jgi:hypothetical protein
MNTTDIHFGDIHELPTGTVQMLQFVHHYAGAVTTITKPGIMPKYLVTGIDSDNDLRAVTQSDAGIARNIFNQWAGCNLYIWNGQDYVLFASA